MNYDEQPAITSLVAAARQAQISWAKTSYAVRAAHLKKAARYLATHVDELTAAIHGDTGKLPLDALAAEVLPAVMAIDYYIKQGRRFVRPQSIACGNLLMFNKQSRFIYRPYGVVGIITPWNYPFAIPFAEVVMGLLAGNAIILKVASMTPNVGRVLKKLFDAADLPDGIFNYVEMPGKEAGPSFIDGGIDKLFFTGSTATGRELMTLAALRLLPLVLELGGADAAIIRSDADLERAANGVIWAGFSNAGQSCGGAQRILVHESVYQAFLDKLCKRVRSLRAGDGPDADLGPLAGAKQRGTVQKQIDECLRLGAKIEAQSPLPQTPGHFFLPATVLTNVTPEMPVMAGEVFGPVVAVKSVKNDEEALRIANESSYGLTGSVWSRNRKKARELAAQVNAGAVMINDHLMSHGLAETPWGGFGDSGLGRTHSELGFREMLKTQVIIDDSMPGVKRNLWWQPYSASVFDGARAIVSLLAGPALGTRLAAIPKVVKVFMRQFRADK